MHKVTYIALLRGINIGKRRVKMEALKNIFAAMGLEQVRTYIQSGNVVFQAQPLPEVSELEAAIAYKLHQELGFLVPVLLRTAAAWQSIITQNPFIIAEPHIETTHLHATFLQQTPAPALWQQLQQQSAVHFDNTPDRWQAAENMLYLYCPQPYHQTPFSPAFLEKYLKVATSTRNWNTVLALKELL